MPIKLPKGFARRKSAGNLADALDALEGEPSSFRVLDRAEVEDHHAASKERRARHKLTDRPKSTNFASYGDSRYLTSRTNISNSSSSPSPSARHSSQTTDHSFAGDVDVDQDSTSSAAQRFSLAQEPSKFSVSRKRVSVPRPTSGTLNSSPASYSSNQAIELARGRSYSSSSDNDGSYEEIALHSRVDLAEGIHRPYASSPLSNGPAGPARSPIMAEPPSFELPEQPRPIYRSESDTLLSAKNKFSFDANDCRPRPLSSRLDRSPSPSKYSSRLLPQRDSPRSSFHSGSSYASPLGNHEFAAEDSSPILRDDSETQLLMDAAYASQALERQLGFSSKPPLPDISPVVANRPRSSNNQPRFVGGSSTVTTPRAQYEETDPLFENSPASTVLHNIRETPSPAQRGTRIMTPAEFEQAKKDAEASRADHDDDDGSVKSDSSDLDEDENESERVRAVAWQRKRQQANMAVYRQQMKKVTGEQPTTPDRLTHSRFSQSLPNLLSNSAEGGDDSDDEIPLGVLQAHGFPSRSRPPTRMGDRPALSSRQSSAQFSAYPAPLGSTRNDGSAGGGAALPPFARNLPADPYVGASLVNQGNRDSLRVNSQSQPAGPPPGTSSHVPPGGLVGVIAGEERARALRRGSPNTDGVYGPTQPPQVMANPGIPGPLRNMGPNEQAQMEMNNSMAQMMQMQMHWMQQMMQLQALSQQSGFPMPPMPPMPQVPGNLQSNLYDAQPPHGQLGPASAATFAPRYQRSTSRLSAYGSGNSAPSAVGPIDGIHGTYAPSIAPSERSNVGQPSRYRPVTPSPMNSSRTSTLSQGTTPEGLQNSYGLLDNPRGRPPARNPLWGYHSNGGHPTAEAGNMISTIRAVSKPKRGAGGASAGASDDEDDAGWAEMRRKREERKSKWKPRRNVVPESPRFEQENIGLEGLYYSGPSDD